MALHASAASPPEPKMLSRVMVVESAPRVRARVRVRVRVRFRFRFRVRVMVRVVAGVRVRYLLTCW